MELEQRPPNGPNFLLIVGLFCATILVIFVLAYFFVDFDGSHLTFKHHSQHPTSQLQFPAPPLLSPHTLFPLSSTSSPPTSA